MPVLLCRLTALLRKYWACAPGRGPGGHRPGSAPAHTPFVYCEADTKYVFYSKRQEDKISREAIQYVGLLVVIDHDANAFFTKY
jgi:hypothetical protein